MITRVFEQPPCSRCIGLVGGRGVCSLGGGTRKWYSELAGQVTMARCLGDDVDDRIRVALQLSRRHATPMLEEFRFDARTVFTCDVGEQVEAPECGGQSEQAVFQLKLNAVETCRDADYRKECQECWIQPRLALVFVAER